jgi:hypothetical protein
MQPKGDKHEQNVHFGFGCDFPLGLSAWLSVPSGTPSRQGVNFTVSLHRIDN